MSDDNYPRCPFCRHVWHGFPCSVIAACGCESSYVEVKYD